MIDSSKTYSGRFVELCEALAAKSPHGQFVLLVDEYDKPLLGALNTPEVVKFRDALKSFYSVIKTKEALQRFTLITGISRFFRVSIFSDLNNLIDISMSADFATLLGYTHDEVKKYFADWIANLAKEIGVSEEEAFDEIVRWYDGYKFHHSAEPVINPVSLGLCLRNREFKRDRSASEALAQIKEKRYFVKFLGSGKKITLVGVNFDSDRCTISEYLTESVEV